MSSDDTRQPPVALYGTLNFQTPGGFVRATIEKTDGTYLLQTRLLFPVTEYAQPDGSVISNVSVPGQSWENAASQPHMFKKDVFTGGVWQNSHESPGFHSYWFFKPTQTGFYRITLKCDYYLRLAVTGGVGIMLSSPLIMGLFLMKAPAGELSGLNEDQVGNFGGPFCRQILVSAAKEWTGGYQVSGGQEVAFALSGTISASSTVMHMNAGEELIPYVGFFTYEYAVGFCELDKTKRWSDILNQAPEENTIYVLSDEVVNSIPNVANYPIISSNTSIGYELID